MAFNAEDPQACTVACNAGYHYSAEAGGESEPCRACPAGHYGAEQGQSACRSCDAGSYEDASASVVACKVCPGGHYGTEEAQPQCTAPSTPSSS